MDEETASKLITVYFVSETGDTLTENTEVSLNSTVEELNGVCKVLLQETDDFSRYKFFIRDNEVVNNLGSTLDKLDLCDETSISIVYQKEATFKVRPVTRCTASMPGHAEAVISASFSPDGKHLASGSGDKTLRLWDIDTQTPHYTCEGHKNWVLCVSWSPDSAKVASACKDGKIILWDPQTGQQLGKTMTGHLKWITSLCWEPYHKNPECRLLASSSKDTDIRIWDVVLCKTILTISGHTKGVTVVKWGGNGLIYSASQDRSVKVWRASDGVLCRTLDGHAHWVNTLALNCDYILKIGAFDPVKDANKATFMADKKKSQEFALDRYKTTIEAVGERLVSGSDDFTLFMWNPEKDKKPVARLTGHQQLVNDVKFTPDARILASASFDKSIRLWDGKTGKFLATLRGHVQEVYMVAFSADSRLMVSGSADSTLKLWNLTTKKLEIDLPGHADQVYAVDWSSDGAKVVSGGKDKVLRLWQH